MSTTVILNGDEVYVEELIRENARLTVQMEVERQKRRELEAAVSQLKQENEALSGQIDRSLEQWSMTADGLAREKVLASKLDLAIQDLHTLMADGDPCEMCTHRCAFGAGDCKPVWRGETEEAEG